jgi:hypothetical protein
MDDNVKREMAVLTLVVAAFVAVLLAFIHFAETGMFIPSVSSLVEAPGNFVRWLIP